MEQTLLGGLEYRATVGTAMDIWGGLDSRVSRGTSRSATNSVGTEAVSQEPRCFPREMGRFLGKRSRVFPGKAVLSFSGKLLDRREEERPIKEDGKSTVEDCDADQVVRVEKLWT